MRQLVVSSKAPPRKDGAPSDGSGLLSSNRPQVQPSTTPSAGKKAVVPAPSAPSSQTSKAAAVAAPQPTEGKASPAANGKVKKAPEPSLVRPVAESEPTAQRAPAAVAPHRSGANRSASATRQASVRSSSAARSATSLAPGAAPPGPSPSPAAVAAGGGMRRPGPAAGAGPGPRFTLPTVSSLAHLLPAEGKDSAAGGSGTPRSGSVSHPAPAEEEAEAAGGAAAPPRSTPAVLRRRPSSLSMAAGGNNASVSETGSLSRPVLGGGVIQRGAAAPIEPGASPASSSAAAAVSSGRGVTPAGSTRRQGAATSVSAPASGANTSLADGAETLRPRPRHVEEGREVVEAAAVPPSPSAPVHRFADPAPMISVVRRKSHRTLSQSQSSDMRDVSQTSHSSQMARDSSVPSTVASPPLTPAERRSASVLSVSSSLPAPPIGLGTQSLPRWQTLPRPIATASREGAAAGPESAAAAKRAASAGTPPADETAAVAASAKAAPAPAAVPSAGTPERAPRAGSSGADTVAEVASPPPASRPTAAPRERSPMVYRIPPADDPLGGHGHGDPPAPPALLSDGQAPQQQRAASEEAPLSVSRRSASPRVPSRSGSATAPAVAVVRAASPGIAPLSSHELSAFPAKAAATTAARSNASTPVLGPMSGSDGNSRHHSPCRPIVAANGVARPARLGDSLHRDPLRPHHRQRSGSRSLNDSSSGPRFAEEAGADDAVPQRLGSSVASLHGSRSHSPGQESIAALLEDLQELRQREEAEAARRAGKKDDEGEEEPETPQESERESQSAAAAAAATPGPSDAGYDRFLFPAEVCVDEVDGEAGDGDTAARPRPSRAHDSTGHAPITPRLRRRIEKEQQRELELLRTITQERHPENVGLLDEPDELIRELGRIDPEMDPAGAEEALLALSSDDADSLDEEAGAGGGGTAPSVLSAAEDTTPKPKKSSVPRTKKTTRSTTSTPSERALPGKPPLRGDVSTASSSEQRRRNGGKSSAATSARSAAAPSKPPSRSREPSQASKTVTTAATTPATRAAAAAERGTAASAKRLFAPTLSSAAAATPASQRAPSMRGRATSVAESNASTSASARFVRRSSKPAVGGADSTAAAPSSARASIRDTPKVVPPAAAAAGAPTIAAAAAVVVDPVDHRRRRTVPDGSGAGAAAATSLSGGGPGAALENVTRTPPRHGSLSGHLSDAPPHAATPMSADKGAGENLLPALFSPEESANTITIVFDLDETLCNNRCLAGTVLRPGAELLLRTLRSLAPSPRYKVVDTRTRGQHASTRLYDQALHKMGMMPIYRPRVAQRQSEGGYHANVPGGSTGEARPATGKETNPLRVELVLWTASEEGLARRAMRRLDPQNAIFDEAIYRDVRWYRDSYYTKELSRLGRSMQRVVIIENSVESVIRNRQNAILVASFITNRLDRQLFLVREVLRDWIRGMKANRAVTCENARLRERLEAGKGDQDGVAGGSATHKEESSGAEEESEVARRLGESQEREEEGGESPVPPRADRGGSGNDEEEPTPLLSAPTPAPPVDAAATAAAADRSNISDGAAEPAPAVMSAVAMRAANIVEFLRRHRLILPETNYINGAMAGEVMMRLQSTEAAAIAASLPPAAETPPPPARTVRTVGCGPAPRSPRSSLSQPTAAAAGPDSAAAPTTTAPASGRASHTPGNGAPPAAATVTVAGRSRAAARGDGAKEVRRELEPPSPPTPNDGDATATAATAAGAPAGRKPSAVLRAARDAPPAVVVKAEAAEMRNGNGGAASVDGAVPRPQRSHPVAAKHQAA